MKSGSGTPLSVLILQLTWVPFFFTLHLRFQPLFTQSGSVGEDSSASKKNRKRKSMHPSSPAGKRRLDSKFITVPSDPVGVT